MYLRGSTPFAPYQTGGSHEGKRRAAPKTYRALWGWLRRSNWLRQNVRLRCHGCVLRDRLIGGVLEQVDGAVLTGAAVQRLDNHASFVMRGVEAEGVLIRA